MAIFNYKDEHGDRERSVNVKSIINDDGMIIIFEDIISQDKKILTLTREEVYKIFKLDHSPLN